MGGDVCAICGKNEVYNKRRQWCRTCYQREYGRAYRRKEKTFAPAKFNLGEIGTYTPDFYDSLRDCFIEVVGSKQAYSARKEQIAAMRLIFPNLTLEVRLPNGELLDEEKSINGQMIEFQPYLKK